LYSTLVGIIINAASVLTIFDKIIFLPLTLKFNSTISANFPRSFFFCLFYFSTFLFIFEAKPYSFSYNNYLYCQENRFSWFNWCFHDLIARQKECSSTFFGYLIKQITSFSWKSISVLSYHIAVEIYIRVIVILTNKKKLCKRLRSLYNHKDGLFGKWLCLCYCTRKWLVWYKILNFLYEKNFKKL
jgi:hypothetical protein